MIPSRLFGKDVVVERVVDFGEMPSLWGNEYSITRANIDGRGFLAIEPRGSLKLPELSRVLDGLRASERRPCVVVCKNLSTYQKSRLTERNVPWLVSEKSCYLPFIAVAR